VRVGYDPAKNERTRMAAMLASHAPHTKAR